MARRLRGLALSLAVVFAMVAAQGIGAADDLAANKAVVARFYDLINAGNTDALGEIIAADVVDHDAGPGQPPGLAGFKTKPAGLRAGFPDARVRVADVIAEGDRVAVRSVVTGTQRAPFNGIPATNKSATFEAFDIFRVSGGKITEIWGIADFLGLLTQLGVVPSSGPPPVTPPVSTAPKGTADLGANRAVALRFYDIFNAGNFDAFGQIVAPDAIDHEPAPGQTQGLEGLKVALTGFKVAFPDLKVTPQDTIAEGDKVVVRSVSKGTNTGSFAGIPASGKPVVLESIDIDRIVNGKIVEVWHIEDLFGVLIQIGAVPAPGASAPAPAPAPPPAPPRTGGGGESAFIRRLGDG